MKHKIITVKEGQKCKLNTGDTGIVIDGPAIVTILEAAPVEGDSTGANEEYKTYSIPPLGIYEPGELIKVL
ncbi:hypothetical protein D3C71_1628590 [compost metagenome]